MMPTQHCACVRASERSERASERVRGFHMVTLDGDRHAPSVFSARCINTQDPEGRRTYVTTYHVKGRIRMNQSRRGHAADCRADAKDPLDGAYAGLNRTLPAKHVPPVCSPSQVPHPLADANDVLNVLFMLLLRPPVDICSCHHASPLLL